MRTTAQRNSREASDTVKSPETEAPYDHASTTKPPPHPRRTNPRTRNGEARTVLLARLFGEPHLPTLRDVLLHVITETACHASHLGAVREHIDDRRWMVLT